MRLPDFTYEERLWGQGVQHIAGIDEVGRGSFAGPVYAACVGFTSGMRVGSKIRIADSKILTQKQREKAYDWIKMNSHFCGLGQATIAEINKIGIGKASFVAMRRAVKNAGKLLAKDKNTTIEHLLIDAFNIPKFSKFPKSRQTAIIKGDSISFSIAAASIIAKVERDRYMQNLGCVLEYKKYSWIKNKGYGTKAHRDAIERYGITIHHRKQFVETYLKGRA